ncbi:MAG: hypothetical protein KGY45_04895, partial [Hadesarchaea archaeon]|nr:hypothetical protein [Hadesarchaea archaeon]
MAESEQELTPLMKKYEEETGKNARKKNGDLTKAYKKWRRKQRKEKENKSNSNAKSDDEELGEWF